MLQVVELEWDDVHGWAGLGGTKLGTTRLVLSSSSARGCWRWLSQDCSYY